MPDEQRVRTPSELSHSFGQRLKNSNNAKSFGERRLEFGFACEWWYGGDGEGGNGDDDGMPLRLFVQPCLSSREETRKREKSQHPARENWFKSLSVSQSRQSSSLQSRFLFALEGIDAFPWLFTPTYFSSFSSFFTVSSMQMFYRNWTQTWVSWWRKWLLCQQLTSPNDKNISTLLWIKTYFDKCTYPL